jgi:hypothetical protein
MTEPIRVDAAELTLAELADVSDAAGTPEGVARAGDNFRQIAAMAWVVKRRTDPGYTFAAALGLRMADIDLGEQPPEVPGGDNGVSPLSSPALGT